MCMWYHVLLELLPGSFRKASGRLGSRQLTVCPPQPLKELLQLSMETFSLHRDREQRDIVKKSKKSALYLL